jgi:hypothetical protein
VRHQGNILASHCSTSCQKRFDVTRIFLPTFRTGCYLRDICETSGRIINGYCCTTIVWCQYFRHILHIQLYSLSFCEWFWGEFDKSHSKTLKIMD